MSLTNGYPKDAHVWRYALRHWHEVRISEPNNSMLAQTYAAIAWLRERRRKYEINMHANQIGFTSFYFRSSRMAVEFKMHFGGRS